MDGPKFDDFTKSLSTTTSRRQALKLFAAAGGGSVLSLVMPGRASAIAPGRCRKNGTICRQHEECCSNFCDPATLRCACAPGAEVCPSTGTCVPACTGGKVFNTQTCQCECPPGFTECGGACCSSAQVCIRNAGCCTNPTTCTSSSECCPDYRCALVGKESRICMPCAGQACFTSSTCCPGFVCVNGVCVQQFA
jgi:hypothetical protein